MAKRSGVIITVVVFAVLVVAGVGAGAWYMRTATGGGEPISYLSRVQALGDDTILVIHAGDQPRVARWQLGKGKPSALWTTEFKGEPAVSVCPEASEHHLALPLHKPNRVVVLDKKTGAVKGEVVAGDHLRGIAFSDQQLVVDDGTIRSIALKDMSVRWSLQPDDKCVHFYFASPPSLVLRGCSSVLIDLATGKIESKLAQFPLGLLPGSPPRLLVRAGADLATLELAKDAQPKQVIARQLGEGKEVDRTDLLGVYEQHPVVLTETAGASFKVVNGRSTDHPAPLVLVGADLNSASVKWRLPLGPWRMHWSMSQRFRTVNSTVALPQHIAIVGRRDEQGTRLRQIFMVNLANGKLRWRTPVLRHQGRIVAHTLSTGMLIEISSVQPYELLLARFDPTSGTLDKAVRIAEGNALPVDGAVSAKQVVVKASKQWYVFSPATLEFVASSADAATVAKQIADATNRVKALLRLP